MFFTMRLAVLWLAACCLWVGEPVASSKSVCNKDQKVCLNPDYDLWNPPPGGVNVSSQIIIRQMLDYSAGDRSVTLKLNVALSWTEPRLNTTHKQGSSGDYVIARKPFDKSLWIPQIYYYNVMEFSLHQGVEPYVLIELANRTVHYSFEVKIKLGCPFSYERYPFIHHECMFRMGSYTKPSTEVNFLPAKFETKKPLLVPASIDLNIVSLQQEDTYYLATDSKGHTHSNYTLAGFQMHLEPSWASHILTYFLPAFVCLVNGSSVITVERNVVTDRLFPLITLQLILVTLLTKAMYSRPPALGQTALETYLIVCNLLNVFLLVVVRVGFFFKVEVTETEEDAAEIKEEETAIKEIATEISIESEKSKKSPSRIGGSEYESVTQLADMASKSHSSKIKKLRQLELFWNYLDFAGLIVYYVAVVIFHIVFLSLYLA